MFREHNKIFMKLTIVTLYVLFVVLLMTRLISEQPFQILLQNS